MTPSDQVRRQQEHIEVGVSRARRVADTKLGRDVAIKVSL